MDNYHKRLSVTNVRDMKDPTNVRNSWPYSNHSYMNVKAKKHH